MAMLGTTLMSGMMSHSDAEKMFRPWWDNIRWGKCGETSFNKLISFCENFGILWVNVMNFKRCLILAFEF